MARAIKRKEKILNAEEKMYFSEDIRKNMISSLAYQKAEKRDFTNFDPENDPKKDWYEAEQEVDYYITKVSEKNNDPGLAVSVLCEALDCDWDDIQVAEQDNGFDWVTL